MIHQASRVIPEKADSPPALALGLSVEAKEEQMRYDLYEEKDVVIRPVDETAVYLTEGGYFVIAQTDSDAVTHVVKLENKRQVDEVIIALQSLLDAA